jgi:hypothetical protein
VERGGQACSSLTKLDEVSPMVRLAVLSPETPADCGHYLRHLSYRHLLCGPGGGREEDPQGTLDIQHRMTRMGRRPTSCEIEK